MKWIELFLFCGMWMAMGPMAQARVFDYNKEKFAAYLKVTDAPLAFNNGLASDSHGSNVNLDTQHPYDLSGEIGLAYTADRAGVRIGLEVVRPPSKDANGTDSSGTVLYSETSEISVLIPKIDVELAIKKWQTSKLFFTLGAGYANLVARNSYSFTAAGNTAYPTLTDFAEDLRSTSIMYEGSLGWEFLLADQMTLVLEGGYRYLNFTSVSHNKDIANFQTSSTGKGTATNMDGSDRKLGLSNAFLGVTFRFWVF